jgi:ABC-type amino acid transport substrate-binding protein
MRGSVGARGVSWILALPVLLALLVGCGESAKTLKEIQTRGALYVGLDPSYPPFEALAPDGVLYGLDVDLGRALAARLPAGEGAESGSLGAHFVFVGYDGLYHALEVGEVDVLISALVVESDRMADVAYSDPYFDAGLVLVVPGEGEETRSMEDLSGGTVAVEYATEADVEARRWSRRLRDLAVRPLTTADEAMAAVVAGTADAALVDNISAHLYLRDHPGLALTEEMVTSEPYAIAVRAEDGALLEAINAALAEMGADGALAEMGAHWLGTAAR